MGKNKSSFRGWGIILLFVIPYIIVVGLFQLLGAGFAGVDILDDTYTETMRDRATISIFDLIGTYLMVGIFYCHIFKKPFVDIGFHLQGRCRDIGTGLLIGFSIMGFVFLFYWLTRQVEVEHLNFNAVNLSWLFVLFLCVAISEELLCRGVILNSLMLSVNKYSALIVSSLIFSLLHYFNPNVNTLSLFNLFLAGLVLGLPYIYTQNLWLPISLHFSWNFFQSVFGFNVSGLNTYSLVETTLPAFNTFNGGEFGFEGSYLCTITELATILFLLYYLKNHHNLLGNQLTLRFPKINSEKV